MKIKCEKCGRELRNGDEAFVSQWKQMETKNGEATFRIVQKYECAPRCPKGGK